MLISIGAISAADTNDTLLEDASDTDVATASVALEQEVNDTSPAIESVNDFDEINVDDSRNENHKVGDASSASDDVLSASDDDLLKHNDNNFFYGGTWYYDFEDALSEAESNNGGTIKIWRGTYKYTSDDDDFNYKINTKGVSITIQPYGSDHEVIFDGEDKGWFLHITNANIPVTINDITFKNGKGNDGPMEVEDGAHLTLNRCIFEGNHASSDGVSYGLGGAIIVDEGSLIANDCRFINNKADRHGGAICIEDSGSVTLNNCYFEGNKKGSDEANDFEDYDIDSGATADWSFDNCQFKGDSTGSVTWELHPSIKSVDISVDVNEDVSHAVLYKDGVECYRTPCGKDDDVSFYNYARSTTGNSINSST